MKRSAMSRKMSRHGTALFCRPFLLTLGLMLASSAAAAATELGILGTQFTVNGTPTFLLGISYYGALGAPEGFIRGDLDDMHRYGFNWIRVWATWSDFDNDVSAVDDSGRPREPYMEKLKRLVAECDRRRMIADVTLTRGEGRVLGKSPLVALDVHLRAMETLARELKPWRNWYVDVASEHNLRNETVSTRHVSVEEARRLRDAVKKVDDKRLVTISYMGDMSQAEARRYLADVRVDFLAPHRPRNAASPEQTQQTSRQYLTWMRDWGSVVPLSYQDLSRRLGKGRAKQDLGGRPPGQRWAESHHP